MSEVTYSPIDTEKIEALGQYNATDAEIAAHLGIFESEVTYRRENDEEFAAALDRGYARRSLALKQTATKKALAGDTAAMRSLANEALKQEGERRVREYIEKVRNRGAS